jgi:hypothetical protein
MKTNLKGAFFTMLKPDHIIKSEVLLMKVKQIALSRLIRIWETREAMLCARTFLEYRSSYVCLSL